MDRVFLDKEEARSYFQSIKQESQLSYGTLACKLGFSARTLRDWKNGVYSFPLKVAKKIAKVYRIELPESAGIKSEREVKSKAGRQGAIARYRKYGNPGTLEGRKRGGRNSLVTHKKLKTGFQVRKSFPKIVECPQLAEFFGIMLGDGGMTETQVRVTLSSRDDRSYSQYVCQLMNELFSEFPSVFDRQRHTLQLALSGKELVGKLNKKGLVIGNKVKQGVSIPSWIYKRKKWRLRVLRGLFDTDGCVYLDRHTRGKQKYKSICLAFTSYSLNLLDDIYKSLLFLKYSPTTSSRNSVLIRKQNEVIRFFKEVNPINERHQVRFRTFMEE